VCVSLLHNMLVKLAMPCCSCRLLGFNTVRLPFRYADLDQYAPLPYVSGSRQVGRQVQAKTRDAVCLQQQMQQQGARCQLRIQQCVLRDSRRLSKLQVRQLICCPST
jgi:hypothetical protein